MKNLKSNSILAMFIAFFTCFSTLVIKAQISINEPCGSHGILDKIRSQTPEIVQQIDVAENAYRQSQNNLNEIDPNKIYYIPVVFHIFHSVGEAIGSGSNISEAQINAQINSLNDNFANYQNSLNGVDTKIKFCRAQIPSSGISWSNVGVNGIMRYPSNNLSITGSFAVDDFTSLNILKNIANPNNAFPSKNYLNIYILPNLIATGVLSGLQGVATFPFMTGYYPIDGIISRADVCGSNINPLITNPYPLNPDLSHGKTIVHEVGHYLGLYHTFGGGCNELNNMAASSNQPCLFFGDMVCDTPPISSSIQYNCNTGITIPSPASLCSNAIPTGVDMFNNFMSYANDACKNIFTNGQKNRMRFFLQNVRFELISNQNLVATGIRGLSTSCAPLELFSEFQFSGNRCINQQIQFNATTAGNTATTGSQFTWTITQQNSTTAIFTSVGTSVNYTFTNIGNYVCSLTVTIGVSSVTTSQNITISSCNSCNPKQHANMYFGEFAGLNFNTGLPNPNDDVWIGDNAANTRTLFSNESSISVSNSSGNVVFYTNGYTFWNASHTPISYTSGAYNSNIEGEKFLVSSTWSNVGCPSPNPANFPFHYNNPSQVNVCTHTNSSISQLAYIPHPDAILHPNEYFVFKPSYIMDVNTNFIRRLVFYHIKMNDNGGAGSITPNYIQFNAANTNLSELITAIPGCDGSWWIVLRSTGSNVLSPQNRYIAFNVDNNGVPLATGTNTLIAGREISTPSNFVISKYGQLKSSPNGHKIAIVSNARGVVNSINGVLLVDFNMSNGTFTNEYLFQNQSSDEYYSGISFSPNSNSIFAGSARTSYSNGEFVNVTPPNVIPLTLYIPEKLIQIDLIPGHNYATNIVDETQNWYGRMQIGPDEKIYIVNDNITFNNAHSIASIDDPNTFPTNSYIHNSVNLNVTNSGIALDNHIIHFSNLPNYNDAWAANLTSNPYIISVATTSCNLIDFKLVVCGESPIITWDFGDGTIITNSNIAVSHQYTSSGSYTVTASNSSGVVATYTPIVINTQSFTLATNSTSCSNSVYNVPNNLGQYSWSVTNGIITHLNGIAVLPGQVNINGFTQSLVTHNCSSITISWITNGTITLDITGGWCNQTLTANHNSSPTVTITNPTIQCLTDLNYTLTANVSGGTPSYVYAWSPTSAIVTPSITNTCNVVINAAQTFTVLVTDANGCTATANTTLSYGAPNTSAIPPGGIISSFWINSLPISNTTILLTQNTTILNNDVVILKQKEIIIAPNVSITVSGNSKLTLDGCYLHSCNYMWDGIVVQNSAGLILKTLSVGPFRYNRIDHAKIAVEIKNSVSIYEINKVIFNNNDIDIKFTNPSNYNGSIENSLFSKRVINNSWASAIMANNTTFANRLFFLNGRPNTPSLPVYNGSIPNKLICIDNSSINNQTLNVGVITNTTNIFDNKTVGISSNKGALNVYNNHFQKLGYGIASKYSATSAANAVNNLNINIGDIQSGYENTFKDIGLCAVAIENGGNLNVVNNIFDNVSLSFPINTLSNVYGIYIYGKYLHGANINNNSIDGFGTGLYYNRSAQYVGTTTSLFSPVNILNNQITNTSTNTSNISITGIEIGAASPNDVAYQRIIVSCNDIRNTNNCIKAYNIKRYSTNGAYFGQQGLQIDNNPYLLARGGSGNSAISIYNCVYTSINNNGRLTGTGNGIGLMPPLSG